MIIGIGVDIAEIARVDRLSAKFGERFARRVLTDDELNEYRRRKHSSSYLATRFAAKEACAKALGTGFIDGIFMKDIEVTNDELGKPSLTLHGGALQRMQKMTPSGHQAVIHLSLTDEPPYAQAQVIIESLPL